MAQKANEVSRQRATITLISGSMPQRQLEAPFCNSANEANEEGSAQASSHTDRQIATNGNAQGSQEQILHRSASQNRLQVVEEQEDSRQTEGAPKKPGRGDRNCWGCCEWQIFRRGKYRRCGARCNLPLRHRARHDCLWHPLRDDEAGEEATDENEEDRQDLIEEGTDTGQQEDRQDLICVMRAILLEENGGDGKAGDEAIGKQANFQLSDAVVSIAANDRRSTEQSQQECCAAQPRGTQKANQSHLQGAPGLRILIFHSAC